MLKLSREYKIDSKKQRHFSIVYRRACGHAPRFVNALRATRGVQRATAMAHVWLVQGMRPNTNVPYTFIHAHNPFMRTNTYAAPPPSLTLIESILTRVGNIHTIIIFGHSYRFLTHTHTSTAHPIGSQQLCIHAHTG